MNTALSYNSILLSITSLLDYTEMDILENVTNHGRRVAYISLRIGERLNFSREDLFDIGSHALLHDVGATQSISKQTIATIKRDDLEKYRDHCIFGQKIIDNSSSFTNRKNIILYHHETVLQDVVQKTGTLFNPFLTLKLQEIAKEKTFWMDIEPQNIDFALVKHLPVVSKLIDEKTFYNMAETISAIVDAKSTFTSLHCKGLEKKALKVARSCGFSSQKTEQFRLAALLHDIGKLVVPTSILNKTTSLSPDEMEIIHEHPYYTEKTLEIMGVDSEIIRWASNHHEKLNGSGYPKGLRADSLDYESRALAALDIYQALTENRPYRPGHTKKEAMEILSKMVEKNELDRDICIKINLIFQ
ncbi:MAG: HD domain-containing protein [Bacteroidales bacterium]|jgi:putative nucleotidyltransferase with HDIG domain|nr:HD domain-containing protein [Bacteroidales bacterium]